MLLATVALVTAPSPAALPAVLPAVLPAALPAIRAEGRAEGRAELETAFLEALMAWRAGEEAARDALLEAAEALCSAHRRCDALEVARTYADMSAEGRARGLQREREFLALRVQIDEAQRTGLAGDDWFRLREDLLGALAELSELAEGEEDRAPAARARALRARLLVEQLDASLLDAELRGGLAFEAREDLARSLELFRSAGMATPRLEPLWLEGRLYRMLGSRLAAWQSLEACRNLAARAGVEVYRERALLSLIELSREAGDLPRRDRLLGEWASFRDPEQSWPLAAAHAVRLLDADHPDEALAFLERCTPAGDADLEDQRQWTLLACGAALRAGDVGGAAGWLEALEDWTGDEAVLARALFDLRAGDPAAALGALEAGGSRGFVPEAAALAHALAGEALLIMDRPAEAARELEAALAVAEAHRRSLEGSSEPNVFGEWVGLHAVALYAEALHEGGRSLAAATISEAYQSTRLREAAGGMADPTALEEADLAAWAAAFELGLATWVVGADHTVVTAVDAGGRASLWRIERGRRAWEEAVRRLREAAADGDSPELRALADELATELFPPDLRRRLLRQAEPDDRLLLLLHGPLERLPESLLLLGNRWLDQRLTPVVLPGLPAARPGDAQPITRWALLGEPSAPDAPLPEAREELEELARLLPGATLLTGDEGDLAASRRVLAEGPALHAAGHVGRRSCSCDDPRLERVALELGRGELLCSHAVAEMRAALPLVVLSGCESARGAFRDAEGLHGLARAFLEGGTRSALVSLWPVEDGAARLHALAFHRALLAGHSPARAAARAREELRAAGLAPLDWGAWRLMGRE